MHTIKTLFLTCSHFNPDKAELQRLSDTYRHLAVTMTEEKAYTEEQISEAEIIVGFPKPEDLCRATRLRWLQTPSAGVGPYVQRSLYHAPEEIVLTNAVGTYGRQIADHVMGMIIGSNHFLFTYHDQMKRGEWKRYFPDHDLWESTILIIGFGDIGQNLAKRAKAHEMQVLAVKRTPIEKPWYVDELHTPEALDSLLGRADYVVICAASTPETENIMHADRIAGMKRGAFLINVARGSLVDQEALIEALEAGRIAGAGLDVTDPEPLPPESKLWSLPNVLITPHASGLSHSDPHQVFSIFLENLEHYLGDGNFRNRVDFARGY